MSLMTVFFLTLLVHTVMAHGAEYLLVWPAQEESLQVKSSESHESYELRKGRVSIAPAILAQAGFARDKRKAKVISKGDSVLMSLFEDLQYQVNVENISYHLGGTTTLSGKLKDHKIGTVTMTVGEDGFLITIQDMNRSYLYRVAGDSQNAAGVVTEIDMKKIPAVIR